MIQLSRQSEELATRLAEAQSISVDEAVRLALEKRVRDLGVEASLDRVRNQSVEERAARRARTDAIVKEIASMPILDPRPVQDIIDDINSL